MQELKAIQTPFCIIKRKTIHLKNRFNKVICFITGSHLPPIGRVNEDRAAPDPDGEVQRELKVLLLHPVHQVRRGGSQPDGGRHSHLLRQRLEPNHGRASSGNTT